MASSSTVLNYSDLFRSNSITSASEMLVAVSFARALARRGLALSMEGVETDLSVLDKNTTQFFEHAISSGAIVSGYVPEDHDHIRSGGVWWIEDEILEHWDSLFPENEEGIRVWTFSGMKGRLWGKVDTQQLVARNLSRLVMLSVGEHLAKVWVDGIPEKIRFSFDSNESEEGGYYLHILSAGAQNPNITETVDMDLKISDQLLDYMKYLHGSIQQNHNNKYSVEEKVAIAAHLGFEPGRVCVRWTRARLTKNNPSGIIEGRSLVILRGIVEDSKGNPLVKYDTISEPVTKEERLVEYLSIAEEHRYMYEDIRTVGVRIQHRTSDLYNATFGNYISDEAEFFLPLEKDENVPKLVTVGDADTMEPIVREWLMPAVDAVYWSLKQWGVEFDESLYIRDNYSEGVEPLYEQYSYEVLTK